MFFVLYLVCCKSDPRNSKSQTLENFSDLPDFLFHEEVATPIQEKPHHGLLKAGARLSQGDRASPEGIAMGIL